MSELYLVESLRADRGSTATLLLAMAREAGLDERVVKSCPKGFLVPAELIEPMRPVKVEVTESSKGAEVSVLVTPEVPSTPYGEQGPGVVIPKPEPDRESIRAWAKAAGIDVADKGRLSKDVVAAYNAAHAG